MVPSELLALFTKAKAVNKDFKSQRPKLGADELVAFLAQGEPVRSLEEFAHFHDRYVLLAAKVNEALDIVAAGPVDPPPPDPDDDAEDPEEGAEETLIHQVEGLAISAVREALPDGMVLDDKVLAEAVTALRAGKHLLLSGPPGTGKSTLAAAICKAVGTDYRTATATADWTTVDTIGAYLPDGHGGLAFEAGLILHCLDECAWLVIDEINRADIDKAFGPLFSLLAGAGGAVTETVTLPYRRDGKRIEIGWAKTADAASADYAVTRSWRLIGTLNDSDKSSLYTLSFAFLRRFAVIDVGLPDASVYRGLIASRLPLTLDAAERDRLEAAAITVATGPIPLGPAIMLDVASFTRRGVTETTAGVPPYDDVVEAFLVALRLYVVPQYEGSSDDDVTRLLSAITTIWPSPPAHAFASLKAALGRVSLAR
jgi:MoxR-like ATPase